MLTRFMEYLTNLDISLADYGSDFNNASVSQDSVHAPTLLLFLDEFN